MKGTNEKLIVDAGPLVALFNRADQYHSWALDRFKEAIGPLYSCEAALSEAMLLLERRGGDPLKPMEMVERGVLVLDFEVSREVTTLLELLRSYADIPMSLADACLVRMSELSPRCRVMTTDSDFLNYRRNRRQVIPVICPPSLR
jgi:uncharacterized protein